MDHNDFSSVSWRNDPTSDGSRPSTASEATGAQVSEGGESNDRHQSTSSAIPQQTLGRNADPLDLAGVGEGILECTVSSPLKEGDGSKDAYISYLVTTNVCSPSNIVCSY
jgi:sorting nexin-4